MTDDLDADIARLITKKRYRNTHDSTGRPTNLRSVTPAREDPAVSDIERRQNTKQYRPPITLDTDWMDRAACKGLDPNIFHPTRGETGERAKAICAKCPVMADCLEYALADVDQIGIMGGTSIRDRRNILHAQGIDRSGGRGPRRGPINHGTAGGAQTHRRRGEQPCEPCRLALNAQRLEQRRAS